MPEALTKNGLQLLFSSLSFDYKPFDWTGSALI